jgi:AcrR family transcriptional regulator
MPKDTFYNLPEEKQRRILEAAKKAFSEKHYKAVTIDSIVALANIPKGSFYQYFDNKDDLFKYMFSDLGVDKKKELFDELEQSKHLKFSELILRMIQRASRFETKDASMLGLKERFLNETSQDVKKEILSDMIPDTMELFEKIIKVYIHNKDFREDIDVDIVAFILTSVTMNIDQYPLSVEANYGDVLIKICNVLEKGLRS